MTETRDWRLEDGPLGLCPECKVPIPSSYLLIEYVPEGEWPRVFAECPDCGDPVYPE